jgi:hypothetical protein
LQLLERETQIAAMAKPARRTACRGGYATSAAECMMRK